jgi:hypothetical protein
MGLTGGQGSPDSENMEANTGAVTRSNGYPHEQW